MSERDMTGVPLGPTGETTMDQPAAPAQQARAGAGEVVTTATQQARAVTEETSTQIRHVAGELRDRVGVEAESQTQRATHSLRQWADEMASMAETAKPDSPARAVAMQVADGGRRFADYVEEQGVSGLVQDTQSFARRRPGAFLAGAALAGFAVGRLAKAAKTAQSSTLDHPGEDEFPQGRLPQERIPEEPGTFPQGYAEPQTPGPAQSQRFGEG